LLRDTDLSGVLGRLFRRLLRGPTTTTELLEVVPPDSPGESLVADLLERGILTTTDKSPVDQYINFTFAEGSPLREARVAILGAGPVGAGIAEGLLRTGVISIALLDGRKPDVAWGSYFPPGPGQARASERPAQVLLKERLSGEGHRSVVALDGELDRMGVEEAMESSDLVVLALERPDPRLAHIVNRFGVRDERPWLHAVIDGNFGLVGPLFLPPDTGCYNDFRTVVEGSDPNPRMTRIYSPAISNGPAASAFFPGLPAHAAIVASFACLAAVHFLIRGTAFPLGRLMIVDFDRLLIDVEDLVRLPRCPVCRAGQKPAEPAFSAEIVTRLEAQRADE
jgi:bacteriocin biosynthesis cyclodehydratase domain-containing protein